MRIVVTAGSEGLDAEVDPRFGRCGFLTLVDTGSMESSSSSNAAAGSAGGAGISTAQAVARMRPDAVLTGNIGPNAFQTLAAAKVKVYTGARGTVKEALEMFERGELSEARSPTAASHAGMGRGMSIGRQGHGRGRR